MTGPLHVNSRRFQADLAALVSIGRAEGATESRRPVFSDAEMQAREWFKRRIESAGLDYAIDGAANIYARLGASGDRAAIMTGAHLDTGPRAGPLDGALGAVAGLECLRRLRELGVALDHPIECVAFTDGARAFGIAVGAEALTGSINTQVVQVLHDRDGAVFRDRLRARGFEPSRIVDARRDAATLETFIELVIESDVVMPDGGSPIGICTAGDVTRAARVGACMRAAASAFGVDAVSLPDTAAREAWVLSRLAPAGTIVIHGEVERWPLTDRGREVVELGANILLNVLYRLGRA